MYNFSAFVANGNQKIEKFILQKMQEAIAALRMKYSQPKCKMRYQSRVGLVVKGCKILDIVKSSSAERARSNTGRRLRKGDKILQIDHQNVSGEDTDEILRGDDVPGSVVKLSVLNEYTEEMDDFYVPRDNAQALLILESAIKCIDNLTEKINDRSDFSNDIFYDTETETKSALASLNEISQHVRDLFCWSADEISRLQAHIEDLEGTLLQQAQVQNTQNRFEVALAEARAAELASKDALLQLQDERAALAEELAALKIFTLEREIAVVEASMAAQRAEERADAVRAASQVLLEETAQLRAALADAEEGRCAAQAALAAAFPDEFHARSSGRDRRSAARCAAATHFLARNTCTTRALYVIVQ